MLEHDDAGFLKGNVVSDIRRSADALDSIRADVSVIKKAITSNNFSIGKKGNNVSQTLSTSGKNRVNVAVPVLNNTSTFKKRTKESNGSVDIATPKKRATNRDALGRFVAKDVKKETQQARDDKTDESRDEKGRFTSNDNDEGGPSQQRRFAENVASAVILASGGIEEVDPSVKAFQEVAEPLARGYQATFGGNKDKINTRWFRRIFKLLNLSRKEDSVYQKTSKKALKEIAEKPIGGGDNESSNGGFLGSLFGKIALMSLVAGSIGTVLIGSIGTVLGVIFTPVGLAIGLAATLAWGLFTEDGKQFFADIGKSIGSSWYDAVVEFKKTFPGMAESLSDIGKDIGSLLYDAVSKVKSGGEYLKQKESAALDFINNTKKKVSDFFSTDGDTKKFKPRSRKDSRSFNSLKAAREFEGGGTVKGLTDAQTRALAAETQRTESNGNARAQNKYGYIGKYQFGAGALADSGLVDLARLNAAKKSSGNQWFKGGQTDFLNNSKNWKIAGGKEAYLNNPGLQDKAFVDYTNRNVATGIRTGGLNANAGAENIAAFAKAAHLKGVGGANDLFLRGIDSVDANGTGAAKYAQDGASSIRNLAPIVAAIIQAVKPITLAQNASSPAVHSTPSIPVPPPVAASPPIIAQLNNNPGRNTVLVTVDKGDVTQDLSDRKIAHIATGGLSGA